MKIRKILFFVASLLVYVLLILVLTNCGVELIGVRRKIIAKKPVFQEDELDGMNWKIKWSTHLENRAIKNMWLLGDALYVFTDTNELWRLRKEDGWFTWVCEVKGILATSPAVWDPEDVLKENHELALVTRDRLILLSKLAGYVKWQKYIDFPAASCPDICSTHIFIGGWDHWFRAISKVTHVVGWQYRTKDFVTALPLNVTHAGYRVPSVYFASQDNYVYCMDIFKGKMHWAFDTEERKLFKAVTGREVKNIPRMKTESTHKIVADPLLYKKGTIVWLFVGSTDNNLYCLDAFCGSLKWRFLSGERIEKGPVVVKDIVKRKYIPRKRKWSRDDLILVMNESEKNNLFGFRINYRKKKVEQVWNFKTSKKIVKILGCGKEFIYALNKNKDIIAIDATTGIEQWCHPFKEFLFFVTNNDSNDRTIYMATKTGHFFAFEERKPY